MWCTVKRSPFFLSPASLQIRFDLRQGVGEWVERAPWKIEWGGGASVENPHVQRVKYCELLVRPPAGVHRDISMEAVLACSCAFIPVPVKHLRRLGHQVLVPHSIQRGSQHMGTEASPRSETSVPFDLKQLSCKAELLSHFLAGE